MTRVTIAFCSGRSSLVPVVDMLVSRLRTLQCTERLQLRLLVVWDRSFEDIPPPHRELQLAGAGAFEQVRCIEPAAAVSLAIDAGATGRCCPPSARGEDALFGARIGHLNVQRVPAYVFHDPFGRFKEIAHTGNRPTELIPTPLTLAGRGLVSCGDCVNARSRR